MTARAIADMNRTAARRAAGRLPGAKAVWSGTKSLLIRRTANGSAFIDADVHHIHLQSR
jgi:hypothetical protein